MISNCLLNQCLTRRIWDVFEIGTLPALIFKMNKMANEEMVEMQTALKIISAILGPIFYMQ